MVMDDKGFKSPERNKSKQKETFNILKNVKIKLVAQQEAGEQNEIRFKKELEKMVPKVNKEAIALVEELKNPMLKHKETNIEEAISYLDKIKDRVNYLKIRSTTINEQQ